jgi:hypothetical protein
MNGLTVSSRGSVPGAGTGWSVKAVGDFDGNGKSDIVSQHTDGSVAICLMDGITGSCRYVLGGGTGWSVRILGDFEGNGKTDIVWQHTDGSTLIWLMDGFTGSSDNLLGPGTGWSVRTVGDFDGDGESDILWRHTDGSDAIWLMNGVHGHPKGSGNLLGAGTGWSVKGLGDFDGDGTSDIVWQHTDGRGAIWLMNGVAMSAGGNVLGAGGWSVQDIGDFNGDLKSDILWRHTDGAVVMWLMNGLSVTDSNVLKESGTGWVPGLLPTPEGTSPPPPPSPSPNSAPVVSAGADQSITLPAAANLNGAAADDGLPTGSLTTTWTLLSGPAPVSFGNPANLSTSATFSAAGTYTLRLSASDSALAASDDIVIVVNGAPLPAPTVSPIPSLSQWESNMTFYGQKHCARLQSGAGTFDERLNSTYYDAEFVYYQIGAYTNSSTWNACAQAAEKVYRDWVIAGNGNAPGYWNFTSGLRRDFEVTGDATSANTVLLLSKNAAYARQGILSSAYSAASSREVSYALVSYIDAEKIGYPRNPQLGAYVDILLGHFDQWFVSKSYRCPSENACTTGAAGQYYIQPFMVGLASEALIKYYVEINPDPRILATVKLAADWMWTHAWDASKKAFWYQNFISDPSLIGSGYWPDAEGGQPDLNLLIAPAYAWLYRMTGDTKYRDQGDQVFVGGVAGAYLDGAKQFNQNYRWSFDFVKWRSGN